MHAAAKGGCLDVLEYVLQLSPHLLEHIDGLVTAKQETPLHFAASAGSVAMMSKLLQLQPDHVNAADVCGVTPVHAVILAGWGLKDRYTLLVEAGADRTYITTATR